MEFHYGCTRACTTPEIREARPGWSVWTTARPAARPPTRLGARADRVIERALAGGGDAALFAHGHLLRVLAARYIDLQASPGGHLALVDEAR